jgi:hypothetical protein
VNRNFILQRDNSQDSSLKLLDFSPKSIPVFFLRFTSQRLLQNPNAPFFPYDIQLITTNENERRL